MELVRARKSYLSSGIQADDLGEHNVHAYNRLHWSVLCSV